MTNTLDVFDQIKQKFLAFLVIKGKVYKIYGVGTGKDHISNTADAKAKMKRFSQHHHNPLEN